MPNGHPLELEGEADEVASSPARRRQSEIHPSTWKRRPFRKGASSLIQSCAPSERIGSSAEVSASVSTIASVCGRADGAGFERSTRAPLSGVRGGSPDD